MPLRVEPGGWAWVTCISVAVNAASSGAGREGAGSSAWFMRERELEREEERETRLQTCGGCLWKKTELEGVCCCCCLGQGWFLDTAVGVGIPLSRAVSGAGPGEWLSRGGTLRIQLKQVPFYLFSPCLHHLDTVPCTFYIHAFSHFRPLSPQFKFQPIRALAPTFPI